MQSQVLKEQFTLVAVTNIKNRVSGTDKRQTVRYVRVEKTECVKTIKGGTAVACPAGR
jgi:hypothetical protein